MIVKILSIFKNDDCEQPTVGSVEEKLDYRCFLNIMLTLIVLMWMSPSNQPFIPAFSNFDRMALEPNTAASVYDSQLVTMANIHSLLVQRNPVISG